MRGLSCSLSGAGQCSGGRGQLAGKYSITSVSKGSMYHRMSVADRSKADEEAFEADLAARRASRGGQARGPDAEATASLPVNSA